MEAGPTDVGDVRSQAAKVCRDMESLMPQCDAYYYSSTPALLLRHGCVHVGAHGGVSGRWRAAMIVIKNQRRCWLGKIYRRIWGYR